VAWLCGGNFYVAVQELRAAVVMSSAPPGGVGSGTLIPALPGVMIRYAAFHLAVSALCLFWSLAGLRLWARWQASGKRRRAYVIAFTQRRLPRVSNRPMLWKELHTEPLFRLGQAAQIIITTAVTLFLIFCAFVLTSVVVVGLMLGNLAVAMNTTVRLMGTAVATMMVLGTAVRAAGAISGERDRQTMDSLLTTPIDNDSIVWAKWWGSVLGVRKAGYCLLLLWLVGVVTGGLSPVAAPWLLLALFAYLAFAAGLGLWFSLRCRSTLRATIWTIVTLIGVSLGHWLLTFCFSPLASVWSPSYSGRPSGPTSSWLLLESDVQTYSLTPPATMIALAFSNNEIKFAESDARGWYDDDPRTASPVRRLLFSLLGVLLYGTAAIVLLLLTAARFTAVTGRLPLPGTVPRRPPPRRQKDRSS
jgi:ABC-type transport system involved in multi-copper enzyme maturation permease subunit